MYLSELLVEDCISLEMANQDKPAVIREMAELVSQSGKVSDVDSLVKALEAREQVQTTGIGHGMAIPHANTTAVKGMVLALGISKTGVEYDSIDNNPVHLIFLLAGEPRMQTSFLSVLSKISRLFRKDEFRDEIRNASSPQEILAIIQSREEL